MTTTLTEIPTATPESVWAALQESDRQRKENERFLNERFAETDRQITETDRQIKKVSENIESLGKKQERLFEETDRQIKKVSENIESLGEKQKRLAEETNRQINKVNETVGSWANNHGSFAEEYFFNSLEKYKQDFFGEKFDKIEKNVKGIKDKFEDEYDILLINGKSVSIIEVKYKAHKNDVSKIVRKAETFRLNFPDYANHRVFLGLATLAFYPDLEQECIDQGIAVIKQRGEAVIIYDKHLKVF